MLQTLLSLRNDVLPLFLFIGFFVVGLFIYYLLSISSPSQEKMPDKKRNLKLPDIPFDISPSREEVKEKPLSSLQRSEGELNKPLQANEDFSVIKYSYSFLAHLTLAPLASQKRYSELKNDILAYLEVKSSITWKEERFIFKGKTILKIRLIGNVLRLYFALPREEISKINIKNNDLSAVKEHAMTPSLIRISGNTGVKRGREAILLLAEFHNLENIADYQNTVFTPPEKDFTTLLEEKLIRQV